MENMESGNGNGTGTRLIDIEGVLMVLMTIITCSKIAHLRSVHISMLPPFGLFPLKENGTYMEPFHEKV